MAMKKFLLSLDLSWGDHCLPTDHFPLTSGSWGVWVVSFVANFHFPFNIYGCEFATVFPCSLSVVSQNCNGWCWLAETGLENSILSVSQMCSTKTSTQHFGHNKSIKYSNLNNVHCGIARRIWMSVVRMFVVVMLLFWPLFFWLEDYGSKESFFCPKFGIAFQEYLAWCHLNTISKPGNWKNQPPLPSSV